jgi:hypothetical protein
MHFKILGSFKKKKKKKRKETHFETLVILMVKTLDRHCHGADLWQILPQLVLGVCPSQCQTTAWGQGCF